MVPLLVASAPAPRPKPAEPGSGCTRLAVGAAVAGVGAGPNPAADVEADASLRLGVSAGPMPMSWACMRMLPDQAPPSPSPACPRMLYLSRAPLLLILIRLMDTLWESEGEGGPWFHAEIGLSGSSSSSSPSMSLQQHMAGRSSNNTWMLMAPTFSLGKQLCACCPLQDCMGG